MVRDRATRLHNTEYNAMLNDIAAWTADEDASMIEYVSIRDLQLHIANQVLEDPADVEAYIQQLQDALLQALKDNKRITL